MATKNKNTFVEFEMESGKVAMTLQMYAIYQLRSKNKSIYDDYNRITTKGATDGDLDIATVLYAAYTCACIARGENDRYGSFEAFLKDMPSDREAMRSAYQAMVAPKKA